MVHENVEKEFNSRKDKVLDLIVQSGIDWKEIGIFGSYARGDYKSTSDIDFCVVIAENQTRRLCSELRDCVEERGADIIFVSEDFFNNSDAQIAKNIRRDYRRLL